MKTKRKPNRVPFPAYVGTWHGLRMRKLRVGLGITLRALSERTRLSINHLTLLERGCHRPTVHEAEAVAAGLKLPLDAFAVPVDEPRTRYLSYLRAELSRQANMRRHRLKKTLAAERQRQPELEPAPAAPNL